MPRAAATADVFNAIAEPRRREILDLLADGGQRPVSELVARLDAPQPAVSKHLAVLRKVGLVRVTQRGPQRLYRLDAAELRPVHDWLRQYERLWSRQLDRIKRRAERMAADRAPSGKPRPRG